LKQVQQLIAGSSDLLLEDAAILEKFPLQESTPKSLSLEVVVEPQTQNHKQQDHSENLNRKSDCSAENGVEKTSFTYQSYGSHLSNYTPFPGNPQQENVGSQGFNQSPGHQWLIPVMSPSEGLVYKPFPGPGFNGAVYGGCGPFRQGPPDGTVMNPTYGVPNFHQAIAVSPFIPPSSYAYFSPHGMPAAMNQSASGSVVEQASQFVAHGSHDQNSNSSLVGADFDTHSHNLSPCNLSNQKFGTISHVKKSRPTRERELAGSPSEKAQGIRIEKSSSFTVPLVSDEDFQSFETRQKPQVIRVVPHNSRSATVSAARIFQSIQEERKQYDLV
jgi:EARLY FLOWERING 3 protein